MYIWGTYELWATGFVIVTFKSWAIMALNNLPSFVALRFTITIPLRTYTVTHSHKLSSDNDKESIIYLNW